jgi:hypothetical protein
MNCQQILVDRLVNYQSGREMNMENRLEVKEWEAEETFAVNPQTVVAFGWQNAPAPARVSEKFENLQEKLANELALRYATVRPQFVRQVVNEAAALAASAGFADLFLPVLAEEKVNFASNWQTRQRLIQERPLLLAA